VKIWTAFFFLLWSVVASAHPTSCEKNASDHTATERVECGMFVGSIAYEQRQLIESAKIVLDYIADLRGTGGINESLFYRVERIMTGQGTKFAP